jgi:hypothetical protein
MMKHGVFIKRKQILFDFFAHHNKSIIILNKIFDELNSVFGNKLQCLIDTNSFHRWLIIEGETQLKVEFINDVDFRKGNPIKTKLFFQTDTIENIASNKISALSRNEPKYIADILFIEKMSKPTWPSIIKDAKEKDILVKYNKATGVKFSFYGADAPYLLLSIAVSAVGDVTAVVQNPATEVRHLAALQTTSLNSIELIKPLESEPVQIISPN